MDRISKAKSVLWIILGIAGAVGITRFIFGLGVTTNLTDNTPWGFWIGFDVMGGVALAAGGFVIAAINYIFGNERMHPISRAAILTAFLGYIAVAVGLLFDLGLPWNIWHMMVFWNPHSPLFEVGWCVMLYLSILFLEFAPVILEKWPERKLLAKIHAMLEKVKIPIVIVGIMLSTLHQSSLGSLFLAMPFKLHPIWYTPILPVIFFVSAICLGLTMVMVEGLATSYLYKKEEHPYVLNTLRKSAIVMLLIYAALRFGDIFYRGADKLLFTGTASILFWLEISFTLIIPLIIFSTKGINKKVSWMFVGAFSGVFGIVMNRLNVGGIAHVNNIAESATFYLPSFTEITISAGVVSGAVLIFFYFIENFNVWEEKPVDGTLEVKSIPKFSSNKVYLGSTKVTNRIKFSFFFVIAFGVTFASISGSTIENKGIEEVKVTKARGGDTLIIDGNRDGFAVTFKHEFHKSKNIECGSCHHMNKPGDKSTGCYECHSGMYSEGDGFKHDWHSSSAGAGQSCFKCHDQNVSKGKGFIKSIKKAKDLCLECHEDMFVKNSNIDKYETFKTASYADAMHGLCVNCHEETLKTDSTLKRLKPNLANCSNCHKDDYELKVKQMRGKKLMNKSVILP
ncbi:MAG: polysulfide reductase NrfD [Candidatus Kapabacteria bacterium]|jgi:predicted CXXCH cytochrome family protein|nr:polysulfide reductase NrfD [Candidatus Kapabacteria bacterium]